MIIKAMGVESSSQGLTPRSDFTIVVDLSDCLLATHEGGATQAHLKSFPDAGPVTMWDPEKAIINKIYEYMSDGSDYV